MTKSLLCLPDLPNILPRGTIINHESKAENTAGINKRVSETTRKRMEYRNEALKRSPLTVHIPAPLVTPKPSPKEPDLNWYETNRQAIEKFASTEIITRRLPTDQEIAKQFGVGTGQLRTARSRYKLKNRPEQSDEM
jgi:hypothetical protein